ncbi:hypothetical protein SAMN04488063_1554 [Halopelagius inordinatus]|uniref:Uncharacterized protein n=1 Tax=Halopelagius inordinatus TaxID=553467 RepID=A0A1I2PLI8_9EURY|nr:hypothetical protein [Halopelagius inordinatus]SFG14281.1 hypothetical protein SAMN04488063_1554 [Halopelagius inordinatus]
MSSSTDTPGDDAPTGWTTEEADDDVHSWLGADERVVCTEASGSGDGWVAYSQPRGELGTSNQVPLTDEPTDRDGALAAAREYMEENSDE